VQVLIGALVRIEAFFEQAQDAHCRQSVVSSIVITDQEYTMSTLILTWTQAFASALAPSLFALALVWLRRHKINTMVIEAVGRAAGEAYKQMVQSGASASNPASLAAAVAEGRDYLLTRIPDTLKAAGLTPEGAAQMVSGELGKLLAIDPSVGVGFLSASRSSSVAPWEFASTPGAPAIVAGVSMAPMPGAAAAPRA
jgi:hypothetical protein